MEREYGNIQEDNLPMQHDQYEHQEQYNGTESGLGSYGRESHCHTYALPLFG